MIVDAENKVLGRLASHVASNAEPDSTIKIVNAEKAVITGSPQNIKDKYKHRQESGGKYTGPFQPISPGRIVGDTIQSMTPEGQDLNIRTYIQNPLEEPETSDIDVKKADPNKRGRTQIGEISRSLGWNPK